MPCIRPLDAYQHYLGGKLKFKIPSDPKKAEEFIKTHQPIQTRCNECVDCLQRASIDWTVRQKLEAITSQNGIGSNLFITFTYDEENIPDFGFFNYEHIKEAHYRLRSQLAYHARKEGLPKEAAKFRFMAVPEYGARSYRPHYHANYFGLWLPDLRYMGRRPSILDLQNQRSRVEKFTSQMLEKIWAKGHIDIQSFGEGSARYLARHNIKQTGGSTKKHLKRRWYAIREESRKRNKELTGLDLPVDWDTGEILPEQMPLPRVYASSRPAIGRTAYEKWRSDFFPSDFYVMDGNKVPVPKYFEKLLKQEDIDLYFQVMEEREKNRKELTPEQLEAREKIIKGRLKAFAQEPKI